MSLNKFTSTTVGIQNGFKIGCTDFKTDTTGVSDIKGNIFPLGTGQTAGSTLTNVSGNGVMSWIKTDTATGSTQDNASWVGFSNTGDGVQPTTKFKQRNQIINGVVTTSGGIFSENLDVTGWTSLTITPTLVPAFPFYDNGTNNGLPTVTVSGVTGSGNSLGLVGFVGVTSSPGYQGLTFVVGKTNGSAFNTTLEKQFTIYWTISYDSLTLGQSQELESTEEPKEETKEEETKEEELETLESQVAELVVESV